MKKGQRKINFGDNLPLKIAKLSGAVWLLCIVGFFAVTGIGTNRFQAEAQETSFGNSDLFLFLLRFFLGLGVLSFIALIVFVILHSLVKSNVVIVRDKSFKSKIRISLKFILILAFFPLFLIIRVVKPKKIIVKVKRKEFRDLKLKSLVSRATIARLIATIAILLTILPIWLAGYGIIGILVQEGLNLVEEPIAISGTGSMYPTFPKGHGKTIEEQTKEIAGTPGMMRYPSGFVIWGKRFLGHEIRRGDIVSFDNEKTREITKKEGGEPSGFVKRVLGLPSDTVEIREGFLYINGEPQEEPYIAKARSTFGGEFLPDCRAMTIPNDKLFVIGDNRKGSLDSRHELGLISFNDVGHVLPFKKQIGTLDKNWRDTTTDFEETSKIRIDKNKYLELLNEERKESGSKPLRYQLKLEKSAFKRGEIILKFDDISYEATKSGYTMEKAMRDVGYSNTTWGEAPIYGYYEVEELIENLFELPAWKEFLLEKEYQDFGMAEVEGQVNGCPIQVVVQHFAGYIPPNYNRGEIEGWKSTLLRLKEIQPSWKDLESYNEFYQSNKSDVDRINEIISIRISNIEGIVARMEANKWLTQEQINYTHRDQGLYEEQESTANRLNSRF